MKPPYFRIALLAAILLAAGALFGHTLARAQSAERALENAAVGTAFSYQGRLNAGGSPVTGNYDFEFGLYTDPAGGTQVGITETQTLSVTEGIFRTLLDFGSNAFTGDVRYIAVQVRPAGGGAFTPLLPRQQLTAVPYAVYAENSDWNGIANIPGDIADGDDVDDADASPTNEIQDLDILSTTLTLSGDASSVELAGAIRDYIHTSCYLYFGWRDSCNGCTDPPAKVGKVNNASCLNVSGTDNTCSTPTIDGDVVRMFGLNPDGDVAGDDKFYIGLRCD